MVADTRQVLKARKVIFMYDGEVPGNCEGIEIMDSEAQDVLCWIDVEAVDDLIEALKVAKEQEAIKVNALGRQI